MNDTSLQLPESVRSFIATRQERGDISAVLLYGSYARGTQHEKSDVDIIFIVDEGFKSECLYYDGLLFEILEATKNNMYEYWKKNLDEDRHWYLWKDVKVIYDRNGEGAEAVNYALSLVGERLPWSSEQVSNHKTAMIARIDKIKYLSETDEGTSAILVVEFVRLLAENWFKIRGKYVPSTKVLLAILATEHPEFGKLLRDFYLNSDTLKGRFLQIERMLDVVYK